MFPSRPRSSGGTESVAWAVIAGLTATAVSSAVVYALAREHFSTDKRSRRLYWNLWRNGDSYWLTNVRVPIAVLKEGDSKLASLSVDDEGLVDCHVRVKDGKIVYVCFEEPTPSKFSLTQWKRIDCHHAVLLPCFSDPHTHLIKTQTVPRNRNDLGTITEALEVEAADLPRWKAPGDIARRMHFAAQCAIHHGTRAIRTHLDGSANEDPEVAKAVWNSFDDIRDLYQDKLFVQGVANLFLPLWTTDMAKDFANQASQHRNVVLGAYCGKNATGNKPDPDFVEAMDALFGHCMRLEMDVDMHIDESNDPECCALVSLCESLAKARKAGYRGRVVLGHCCALSLQDQFTQQQICERLAALDAVVVANPFTNLGLQDRKGGKAPHSLEYPVDVPRTPQWRGLTLMQELRAAGVAVASASDNVRDHWYPFGDFDMLSVWKMTCEMGHVEMVAGQWADLVTTLPAKAMGTPHCLGDDEDADLILFPNARRISELFARPQTDRLVLRRGRVQSTRLPLFSELDDLVAVRTERGQSNEVRTLSS